MRALMLWGEKAYIDYLKAISGEEISAIPRELRLTYEEERAILRILYRKMERQDTNHHGKKSNGLQLLTLRYELLCRGKEHVTATIKEKKDVKMRPLAHR